METQILDDDIQYTDLQITAQARSFLNETAKWAKFLSIVGFIFTGLFVILGLFFGTLMGSVLDNIPSDESIGAMGGMMSYMGFFYAILGLLYLIPSYYLYGFANKTKKSLMANDSTLLTTAFENHKSVYKFWGIFMIIILGFYALIFVVGILGGLASLL